jgi:hypothetical protein
MDTAAGLSIRCMRVRTPSALPEPPIEVVRSSGVLACPSNRRPRVRVPPRPLITRARFSPVRAAACKADRCPGSTPGRVSTACSSADRAAVSSIPYVKQFRYGVHTLARQMPANGGNITPVNTLRFIDSMTGRLAWPVVVLALSIVFRRPVSGLLTRIRRLRWGEREAELDRLVDAADAVQDAVEEASEPLPGDHAESERTRRERIANLLQQAAEWGFVTGRHYPELSGLPEFHIDWDGDRPLFLADRASLEAAILQRIRARSAERNESPRPHSS